MATSIQTCYRHDDRRAGVRCQRCDRPICPQCMNQASVGFHCPECTRKGGQRVYTARSLVTTPYVTVALIATSAVVFVLELVTRSGTGTGGDLLRPGSGSLRASIGDVGVDLVLNGPAIAGGDWWRPVTSGFVHYGLIHVGFNMFLLYQLGLLLEAAVGRIAFTSLFVVSLVGGSFLVLILDPGAATAGASGAVFGLMGAAVVGLRARGIPPMSTSIGTLLVLNLVFTFAIPGVSIGGHLGGLAAGLVGGWLLFELAPRLDRGRSRPAGRRFPDAHWWTTALYLGIAVALYGACLFVASNPV